jgi:hypothetical protein
MSNIAKLRKKISHPPEGHPAAPASSAPIGEQAACKLNSDVVFLRFVFYKKMDPLTLMVMSIK